MHAGVISKERVGGLSDGVMAIAATILVLELKVPVQEEITMELVLHWARVMFGWLVSFAVIGIAWFDNQAILRQASGWSESLTMLTMAQLGAVSLIPFASNLIVDHPESLLAAVAFSGVILLTGIFSATLGQLLIRRPHLHASPATAAFLQDRVRTQLLIFTICATAAVLGALWHHPFLGIALWVLSPVSFALLLRRRHASAEFPEGAAS
jgi:uncharacterized membrane protein